MGGPGSGDPSNGSRLTSRGGQWKKGQSGNPKGVGSLPKTVITIELREMLTAVDSKGVTLAHKIADALIRCAIDPDPDVDKTRLVAISEIIDRCEGKAKQQLELNDVTTQLRQRSDADLVFHLEHGYWPEDEYQEKRNRKIIERLEAAKPPTDTTQ